VTYGRTGIFDNFYGAGTTRYIPSSAGYRDTTYDRVRNGIALAAQWENVDRTLLMTAQYNRSTYENTWREHGVIAYFFDMFAIPTDFRYRPGGPRATWAPMPAQGSPAFTFDEEGNFESGILNIQQTDTFWWGASDAESAQIAVNDQGQAMMHPCYNWQATCTNPLRAPDVNAVTRYNENRNMTQDASLNLRWRPTERLRMSLDAQYVDSEVKNYDMEVGQYTFANVGLDASGGRPELSFFTPTNINQSRGGLTNPNNYRYNHVMDHMEDSEGHQLALRADGEYDFETEWLNSLRVGARYADRNQTVRYSAFNWANIANNWNLGANQNIFWNIDRHTANGPFRGYPTGLYGVRDFGGSFFGSTNQFVFADIEALADRRINGLSFADLGVGQDQWAPICERSGEIDGCFRQVEINDISEETMAAYAMLRFGGPNSRVGGMRVSGNLGLRYVRTVNTSAGALNYADPFVLPTAAQCTGPLPPPVPGQPPASVPRPVGCYLSADDIAFASGGGASSTVRTTHNNFLPSFNLRLDLSDTWLVRFAASRAMSRPDIGLLKNYVAVNASLPGANGSDPRFVRDASGNITRVNPSYTADAYNPSLAPTTAWQFDVSLENYFANVGSFSLAGFYKNFDNYIQYGAYNLDVTNNGVTRTVQVRGPMNGEGAEVLGFEVAYQRFFDFLPAPFNGLGIQANYTFVENNGITNANLKNASGGGSGATAQPGSAGTVIQVDQLEGLSRHAFNLVGMFERGPLAVRVAYNWRSRYLVTAVDCCVYLPIWQESAGFLDASIRFRVSDNLELSIQGSNLLDTQTILKQQVTDSADGGVLAPNAWLHSDRRFVFGARLRF
jgi:TonB-dependent receptor